MRRRRRRTKHQNKIRLFVRSLALLRAHIWSNGQQMNQWVTHLMNAWILAGWACMSLWTCFFLLETWEGESLGILMRPYEEAPPSFQSIFIYHLNSFKFRTTAECKCKHLCSSLCHNHRRPLFSSLLLAAKLKLSLGLSSSNQINKLNLLFQKFVCKTITTGLVWQLSGHGDEWASEFQTVIVSTVYFQYATILGWTYDTTSVLIWSEKGLLGSLSSNYWSACLAWD